MNYDDSFEIDDESDDDESEEPAKPVGQKQKVIDVAQSFKQRKIKNNNIIGAKMRCDENGW